MIFKIQDLTQFKIELHLVFLSRSRKSLCTPFPWTYPNKANQAHAQHHVQVKLWTTYTYKFSCHCSDILCGKMWKAFYIIKSKYSNSKCNILLHCSDILCGKMWKAFYIIKSKYSNSKCNNFKWTKSKGYMNHYIPMPYQSKHCNNKWREVRLL